MNDSTHLELATRRPLARGYALAMLLCLAGVASLFKEGGEGIIGILLLSGSVAALVVTLRAARTRPIVARLDTHALYFPAGTLLKPALRREFPLASIAEVRVEGDLLRLKTTEGLSALQLDLLETEAGRTELVEALRARLGRAALEP